eukprot:snap_masked-scaffold_15-processed-gene-8.47-mRNA-1 protein AED:1.00 eAED:1.00 QI:0/-1/0/0/-1/1/1/0/640
MFAIEYDGEKYLGVKNILQVKLLAKECEEEIWLVNTLWDGLFQIRINIKSRELGRRKKLPFENISWINMVQDDKKVTFLTHSFSGELFETFAKTGLDVPYHSALTASLLIQIEESTFLILGFIDGFLTIFNLMTKETTADVHCFDETAIQCIQFFKQESKGDLLAVSGDFNLPVIKIFSFYDLITRRQHISKSDVPFEDCFYCRMPKFERIFEEAFKKEAKELNEENTSNNAKKDFKSELKQYLSQEKQTHLRNQRGFCGILHNHDVGKQKHCDKLSHCDTISGLEPVKDAMGNSSYLISASFDGLLKAWNLEDGQVQSYLDVKNPVISLISIAHATERRSEVTSMFQEEVAPFAAALECGSIILCGFELPNSQLNVLRNLEGLQCGTKLLVPYFDVQKLPQLLSFTPDGVMTYWNLYLAAPKKISKPKLVQKEKEFCILEFLSPVACGEVIDEFKAMIKRKSQFKIKSENFTNKAKSSAISYTATNLVPGETYTFSFQAQNRIGWSEVGEWSDEIKCRSGVPDEITELNVTLVQENRINLTWSCPFNGGDKIKNFALRIKGGKFKHFNKNTEQKIEQHDLLVHGENKDILNTHDICTYTCKFLDFGFIYQFKVAAVNNFGHGKFSPPSKSAETVFPLRK